MNFEEVAAQYAPMISKVLRKAKVYKNHEFYRSSAQIGLWQAMERFDPEKGNFKAYAFHTMLMMVYREMAKDNAYSERVFAYEKEELNALAKEECFMDEEEENLKEIRAQLDMLSDEEFGLIVDLYVHRYKYEELTVKYNASVAALKKRRDRIVKKARAAKEKITL